MLSADRIVVAVTDDLAFRVLVARTTTTVAAAIDAQKAEGPNARRLAELMTGAVLYRSAMAPHLRVQGILKGASESGHIVADSHPEGWARGLVNVPDGGGPVDLGAGAVLQMMRTLPSGDLHQGVVYLPGDGGIASALMSYMQQSEQTVSCIDVACLVGDDDGRVITAGGYMVELLPEAPEGVLAVMTERLAHDFAVLAPILAEGSEPDAILDDILYGMPHHRIAEYALRFGCNCSQVRVMASLATLKRGDIEELMKGGTPLQMTCDYCRADYQVEPEALRGLLQSS